MYLLYTILLTCALPIFVARLYLRSIKDKNYRLRLAERFVMYKKKSKVDIWVHAVSLGEMIAITPLIQALLAAKPEIKLLITTTTPSGSAQVQRQFSGRVAHVYIPYDLPCLVKRFLVLWQPRLALFVETEVWPNTLRLCHRKQIKTMLVNARLSETSYHGYAKWRWLVPNAFSLFDFIAAQASPDAKRFENLGAKNVAVLGNLKFDMTVPEQLTTKADAWRRGLTSDTMIFIAASTHPGEEEQILSVFHALRKDYPHLKLLLVPRHPERKQSVLQLCQQFNFQTVLRSEIVALQQTDDIVLVDTMGELLLFYAISDIVFVGGSLVPHGGHNLIEPCALGKVTLSGPFVKNFQDLQRILMAAEAAIYVNDAKQLENEIRILLTNVAKRTLYQQQALAVVKAQQGSLQRQLAKIISFV